jgi:hypothetical protein
MGGRKGAAAYVSARGRLLSGSGCKCGGELAAEGPLREAGKGSRNCTEALPLREN